MRAAIERAGPSAVPRVEPDGTSVDELYVPLFDDRGRVQAVFELYEPIDQARRHSRARDRGAVDRADGV